MITTLAETPNSGVTLVETPPFQIDSILLKTLLEQGIATTLATHEVALNQTTRNSRNGGGIPIITQNNSNPCSYKDFMGCKPRSFFGMEGVVDLYHCIEKMEVAFRISSLPNDCRVKYATCTLMDFTITWWNNHAKSIWIDATYAMDWELLKQKMTEEYYPRQEVLEKELWNLTMKGSEVTAYTSQSNGLTKLYLGMVNPKYKKTKRYIWGLASPIQGLVNTSRPTIFDSAKRLAYQLTE